MHIKVVSNASRTKIAGLLGDRLKIAVSAPPEDGKANKMLCKFLAKTLNVSPKQVTVEVGHTQPQKTIAIAGLSLEQAVEQLQKVIR